MHMSMLQSNFVQLKNDQDTRSATRRDNGFTEPFGSVKTLVCVCVCTHYLRFDRVSKLQGVFDDPMIKVSKYQSTVPIAETTTAMTGGSKSYFKVKTRGLELNSLDKMMTSRAKKSSRLARIRSRFSNCDFGTPHSFGMYLPLAFPLVGMAYLSNKLDVVFLNCEIIHRGSKGSCSDRSTRYNTTDTIGTYSIRFVTIEYLARDRIPRTFVMSAC